MFPSLQQLQFYFVPASYRDLCIHETVILNSVQASRCVSAQASHNFRAANNFSFLKGRMSDQVSILVGQNRTVVERFFKLLF